MNFDLPAIVEALLIASEEPLTLADIERVVKKEAFKRLAADGLSEEVSLELKALAVISEEAIEAVLQELNLKYEQEGRSFSILQKSKGWKIYTRSEYGGFVSHLFPEQRAGKLSKSALETLAVIAYRQPVTKAAVEGVRGVACEGMIQKLLSRGLIKAAGQSSEPGKLVLYETTGDFLDSFGLTGLDELPDFEALKGKESVESKNKDIETEEG